jgi:hypothetical protein
MSTDYDRGVINGRAELLNVGYVSRERHEIELSKVRARLSIEINKAEAKVTRVEALAKEWRETVFKIPVGHPMTVDEFCRKWFVAPLDAALAGADPVTTDHAAQKLAEMRDLRGISTTEHEEHQP